MIQSDADKQNMPTNHYSMTGTSTPAEYSGRWNIQFLERQK